MSNLSPFAFVRARKLLQQLELSAGLLDVGEYHQRLRAVTAEIESVITDGEIYFFVSCFKELESTIKAFQVAFVRSLLLCNQTELAKNELSKGILSHGIRSFPAHLILRVLLNAGIDHPVRSDRIAGERAWVQHYARTAEDLEHSVEMLNFKVKFEDGTPVLSFSIICPSCFERLNMDYGKNYISEGVCFCRNCFAKLRLDRDAVAEVGRNYFRSFLKAQPRVGSGFFAEDEALVNVIYLAIVLKPMVHVRFGKMRTERVGHQIMNATHYYSNVKNRGNTRTLDVLGEIYRGDESFVANRFLQEKINKVFETEGVVIDPVASQLADVLPEDDEHNISKYTFHLHGHPDKQTPLNKIPLSLSDPERQECEAQLRRMGIPEGAEFVCLHVRTSEYLREWFRDSAGGFSYHNYRDSDINDYTAAVRLLNECGIYVLRLGAASNLSELAYTSPLYIDYAREYRSEMMDVFLSLHCRFMISTGSGIDTIPWYYGIPLLIVNYHPIPFAMPDHPWFMLITKKLFCKKLGRNLSLMEQVELGGGFYRSQHIEARGLEIIDNTPEEILTVTKEMLDLLEGRWTPTPEYTRKLELIHVAGQYLSLLQAKRPFTLRFGEKFLLENTWDV
jgi:putative glycosyltransferase (TIGR04372 family)